MSERLGQIQSTWQAVLAQLRRKSICWRGTPLSDQDRLTFTEAIVMWALLLMDISSPYGLRPMREYVGWANKMADLDVDALGNCLSDLVSLIRTVYKPMPEDWFKRQLRDEYPFIGELLAPVRSVLAQFLSGPTAGDFTTLYQFFSFLTHLTLVDIDIDMEPEYVELEESLHNIVYDRAMLEELNSIMRDWFQDFRFSPDTFRPYHGPGATAECNRMAGSLVKYQTLGSDQLLDYFVSKHVGASVQSFYPSHEALCVRPFPGSAQGNFERVSTLVVVPKSLKTKRTISTEPSTLIFFQEGAKDEVVNYIHRHPFLGRHINFELQELNGELALVGSDHGEVATVDLSSASDRVTQTLVKSVFRGTPFYSALVSLRSHSVKLPSGRVLRLEKYAPMGSALCFPVQTLIFSAIVEYTVRRTRTKWGENCPVWRVYGDDIIVEEPCYWDLIHNLKACGFKVNTAKSYSMPYRFRESCGYEGYDGVEVSPMRISRRYKSVEGLFTSGHAPVFEGLVDMANSALRYRFPLLRAWIVRVILDRTTTPPLFSRVGDGALHSPCPDNYRAKLRPWSIIPRNAETPWLQLDMVRVVMAVSFDPKADSEDADLQLARYHETLRKTENRSLDELDPDYRVEIPWGPGESILVARWVPLPPKE